MSDTTYTPAPIDTANVVLTDQLTDLNEQLAENIHELWAQERIAQGWRYGPQRDDTKKEHPCLVPYDQLPDSEKEFDRHTAVGTLKTILKLGHRIEPRDGHFTIEGTQALAAWEKHLNSCATDARSRGPRSWTFDMDDQPEIDWLEKNQPQLERARAALQAIQTTVYPAWQNEDAHALRKQKWHHRTAAIAIWPGIAGIIFAIVQLTYRSDTMLLGLMETFSVVIAALAVIGGFYFHLHHGWLAHRQCAERLRILKFTALSWPELWSDFPAWQRRLSEEVRSLTTINTKSAHHWAQEKETLHPELPEAVTCAVSLPDLQAISIFYRIKRLEFQRHYFEHQSNKAHSRSWIVDLKVGLWIFALSVIIVLIHGMHSVYHGLHDWLLTGTAAHAAPGMEAAHAAAGGTVMDAAHGATTAPAAHGTSATAHELTYEILGIALAAVLPVIGFGFRAWLAAFEAPRSRNLFRAKALAIDDYIARGKAGASSVNQTLSHIAYSEHFFNNEHREWCRLQMEAEWFV